MTAMTRCRRLGGCASGAVMRSARTDSVLRAKCGRWMVVMVRVLAEGPWPRGGATPPGRYPHTRAVVLDQLAQLPAVHDLLLHQPPGDGLQGLAPRQQDLLHRPGGFVDDLAHLEVDLPGRPLAVAALAAVEAVAQEAGPRAPLVVDAPQPAHAELLDHAAGDAAGLLQVAGGAVGDLPVHQLLGDGAAQGDLDLALQLRLGHQVAV